MAVMITPTDLAQSVNNAWTDYDASALVSAEATGVILHVVLTGSYRVIGFRKNGCLDDVKFSVAGGSHFWTVAGLDAAKKFEYYVANNTDVDVYLVGYFEGEAVFFDTMPQPTPTGGLYQDYDMAADTGADTAIGVFVLGVPTYGCTIAGRKDGTSFDYKGGGYGCIVAGCVNEVVELYRSTSGDGHFFIAGYLTDLASFSDSPANASLTTTESFQDLSLGTVPANAVAAIILAHESSGGGSYALRKDNTAENIYYGTAYVYPLAIVELGAGAIEGKISDAVVDFYVLGFLRANLKVDFSATPLSITIDPSFTRAFPSFELVDFSSTPLSLTVTPSLDRATAEVALVFSSAPITITITPSFDEVRFADVHGNLVATLPAISSYASGRGSGQINVSLPAVTTSGFIHGTSKTTGNIAGALPAVAAEIVSGLVIEAELPAITASMTGLMGTVGSINVSLPALTAEIVTAWGLNLTLPAVSASMTGLMGSVGALNAPLPGITFDATVIQGIIGRINASLPALRRVTMGGLHELLLDMDVALPALQAEIRGTTGIVASFSQPLFIWPLQAEITGRVEHIGRINATLPAIQATLTWFDALYGAVRTFGLVENTLNFGLTTYSGYLLNSMTKVNGRQIGCNINGLFELIGNRDAGTRRIEAEIELPPLDYGDGMITRVRDVWLTKRCDGALLVTIVPDEGDVFDYQTLLVNDEVHQERVKLGRGLKARYNGFVIKNLNGADFEIDGVSFLGEPVEHRKR